MSAAKKGSRYDRMFASLEARDEGAFVPFLMLGDPTTAASARLLRALVEGGADAVELGIPFSDPVADGPVVEAAAQRALASGATLSVCFELVASLRREAADLPIGLLTYANRVVRFGLERFYTAAYEAGADSVLVADVPVLESDPFVEAARKARVAPVLVAPPAMPEEAVARLATRCEGYVYAVARKGITGADRDVQFSHRNLFERLRHHAAPPPLLGFGIARPEHVAKAIAEGASGAISGSAIVSLAAKHADDPSEAARAVAGFVRDMKAATRR